MRIDGGRFQQLDDGALVEHGDAVAHADDFRQLRRNHDHAYALIREAAQDVRDVIAAMPADRVIIETDCPYLAPIPHRGRRNEPAYLPAVLAKLAEIRGWSAQEAEQKTEDAFFALFDRIPRP